MNNHEFHALAATIAERWPFESELARAPYVARLWETVRHIAAADVERAIESCMAEPYRGRSRPTPGELAERVRQATAPVGTVVRYPERTPEQRAAASRALRDWRSKRTCG